MSWLQPHELLCALLLCVPVLRWEQTHLTHCSAVPWGQQTMQGQSILPGSNTSALWLWLLLLAPCCRCCSLPSPELCFPLQCWVQPTGVKTQSFATGYSQPEPRPSPLLTTESHILYGSGP